MFFRVPGCGGAPWTVYGALATRAEAGCGVGLRMDDKHETNSLNTHSCIAEIPDSTHGLHGRFLFVGPYLGSKELLWSSWVS